MNLLSQADEAQRGAVSKSSYIEALNSHKPGHYGSTPAPDQRDHHAPPAPMCEHQELSTAAISTAYHAPPGRPVDYRHTHL